MWKQEERRDGSKLAPTISPFFHESLLIKPVESDRELQRT